LGDPVAGRSARDVVYKRLDEALAELRERLGGLPRPHEAEAIWSRIWHNEAHNSTALEGNTLVLREVETLLDEGKAVGAKPLRDYLEVRGYADAATWVYGQASEPGDWQNGKVISLQEIRHIHHLCMTPVWTVDPHPHADDAESPGSFRRHEIMPFPDGMTPPSWTEIDHRLADWVDSADRLHGGLDDEPLSEALARIHCGFEQIHPFLDGNGRTGRLVLNLFLVRLGYPPAIIFKRERETYLKAMRSADRGKFGPLGELLARSITSNLYQFVMPAVAGPVRLVPLAALASKDLTEHSLRMAAARGRLRAFKGDDGLWRSSKVWVDEYQANRYQRLPKP